MVKSDLMEYLLSCSLSLDLYEAEIAMYWLAYYNHSGQASDLYVVLCASPYNPGPMMTLEKESDVAKDYYNILLYHFILK